MTLGPETRIDVRPATAEASIDGVALGPGSWQGRLPAGVHRVSASEPGYVTRAATLDVVPSGAPHTVRLDLPVDPNHPRWPKSTAVQLWLGATASWAFATSLGSDAEACEGASPCDASLASGFVGGLRGGLRFSFGLSLELEAGYLR